MQSNTYGEVSIKKVADIIRDRVTSREGEYNVMIGTDSQNFDKTKVVVVIALHEVGKGGVFFFDITRVPRRTKKLEIRYIVETINTQKGNTKYSKSVLTLYFCLLLFKNHFSAFWAASFHNRSTANGSKPLMAT